VLFFELFPLFVAIVCALVATGLYFANRQAPDDRSGREERRRLAHERRERARHLPAERGGRRPSMSA
jgi:hypothetical protein